jgi:hypothetical protein
VSATGMIAVGYVMSRDVTRYHTWRVVGDLDALVGLVGGAVLVVPPATLLACRLGRVRCPRLAHHFGQAAAYYALLFVGGIALWRSFAAAGGGLGWAAAAVLAGAALVAILLNAVTLGAMRFLHRGDKPVSSAGVAAA